MMDDGRHVVMITGASTGFGRRTAELLARRGHRIIATMRHSQATNEAHAGALRRLAATEQLAIDVVDLDVTDDASVATAVAQVRELSPRVDVLVNNAGFWGPGVLESFSMEEWRSIFEVNVFGSVRVAREVLPLMREQGSGLIVQISSLQGRFVLPYSGPYVASKFAVEAAMETFMYEVAPFDIEVTIIEPYDFMTEMKDKAARYAASDLTRAEPYGAGAFIEQAYLTPDPTRSGDPMLVVDAIRSVIEASPGTRPVRLTVGNPLPQIEQINRLADEMHHGLFPNIGLPQLLRDRTSRGHTPPTSGASEA